MRTPPALPPELAASPFTVEDARRSGVPYARLRRPDLVTPYRGVRGATTPSTALERCHAFAPLLRRGQAFCGLSAAAIWGMWLPRGVEEDPTVEVLAVHPVRAPRMRGVRGHHADGARLALVAGLPVTAPAETWCDLSIVLELDALIAAGDSLVRRQAPRCTVEELLAAVERRAGRPGCARARRAVAHVRAGCDSPRETALRLLLHRARLPHPEVNGRVSEPGARVRFGDLVFREWKVIVEYDGEHHRRDARQYAADIVRLEELARAGWTVIRVLKEHFRDPTAIVARVVGALRDRGWRGTPSKSHLLRVPRANA